MTKKQLIKKLHQTKGAGLALSISSARQRNRALREIAKTIKQHQISLTKLAIKF
jgi:gamma-glutamyl phosphate reductase